MARRSTRAQKCCIASAVALSAIVVSASGPDVARAESFAPNGVENVVVIVVDDMRVDDLVALPKAQALLGGTGVTFDQSFVNTSNCCPSRATFLTGQRSPNHGVLSTKWEEPNSYASLDHDNTLPVWLEDAGFATTMIGKYLNGFGYVDLDPDVSNRLEVPPGWTNFNAFIGEKTWTDFTLSSNGELVEYRGDDNYQTDVLARLGVDAISDAVAADEQFFMWMTPFAPHTQGGKPPEPATRHEHAFDGVELPMPPNFNEVDLSDKPAWLRGTPKLTRKDIKDLRNLHEGRLESLLAVDDLVEDVVERLDAEGVLDDTMIVLTSDNGWMLGNHRVEGKIRVYEESIRVPLIISGGPFSGGLRSDSLVSNMDLAPTIAAQLGITPGLVFDGIDLSGVVADPAAYANRALIVESDDGPGYSAVRTAEWLYVDYVGSATEQYDMGADPYQLSSVHKAGGAAAAARSGLVPLLASLVACSGASCAVDSSGAPLRPPEIGDAPDGDSDGVPDTVDNCPAAANADQADADGDGAGDVCDGDPDDGPRGDRDGDGVDNSSDNCGEDANADQADIDGDGIGDVCDPVVNVGPASVTVGGSGFLPTVTVVSVDSALVVSWIADPRVESHRYRVRQGTDSWSAWTRTTGVEAVIEGLLNGVPHTVDIGVRVAGKWKSASIQATMTPGAAAGGPTGDDADGDGVVDATDNCPAEPNPEQGDVDGDGIGDACDIPADGTIEMAGVAPAPTMRVTPEGTSVRIDWDAVAGAVKYQYRHRLFNRSWLTSPAGQYTAITLDRVNENAPYTHAVRVYVDGSWSSWTSIRLDPV